MTKLVVIVALIAFVWWFLVQWRKIPRRWCEDLDLHDFHAVPGTDLEECRCGEMQRRQS